MPGKRADIRKNDIEEFGCGFVVLAALIVIAVAFLARLGWDLAGSINW